MPPPLAYAGFSKGGAWFSRASGAHTVFSQFFSVRRQHIKSCNLGESVTLFSDLKKKFQRFSRRIVGVPIVRHKHQTSNNKNLKSQRWGGGGGFEPPEPPCLSTRMASPPPPPPQKKKKYILWFLQTVTVRQGKLMKVFVFIRFCSLPTPSLLPHPLYYRASKEKGKRCHYHCF